MCYTCKTCRRHAKHWKPSRVCVEYASTCTSPVSLGHCVCTGAWIITGGTHTGVMKHVGEAVRDYTLSSSMQSQIVTIGVVTWGIIHNRASLVHPKVG